MMKKGIIIFLIFIGIGIGSIYLLIPGKQIFVATANLKCPTDAVNRLILNKTKWPLWWPNQKKEDKFYNYKNYAYNLNKFLLSGIEIILSHNRDTVNCFLKSVSTAIDSSQLQFSFLYTFSLNPITRLKQYIVCTNFKENITSLLADIKAKLDVEENIYGMKIVTENVTETSFISLKQTFAHYPTTNEIYNMIGLLKNYISEKNGEYTGYPMLNVHEEMPNNFETMVALNTKSELPSTENFRLKKMHLGIILMGEITGGIYKIKEEEKEMVNYVNDHKKLSPAIPFQTLVTDRIKEADTTKWVTRLYYPIFQ